MPGGSRRARWPGCRRFAAREDRELVATIPRAALSADGPVIAEQHVGFLALGQESGTGAVLDRRVRPLADVERDHISGRFAPRGGTRRRPPGCSESAERRSTGRSGPSN